jgi:hypothetical protein
MEMGWTSREPNPLYCMHEHDFLKKKYEGKRFALSIQLRKREYPVN